MNARTVFLAGLAVALCNSAAYAKDCEIRSSELDAFAQYRRGPLKAMPKGVKRLPHCAVYPKYHAYDCEFVDAEGTRYLAADNDIAKIVRRARTSRNLPLSYPLKFGMPVERPEPCQRWTRKSISASPEKRERAMRSIPGNACATVLVSSIG
ncbi:MAG TPA: hypothetical protein VHC39_16255 [Rhizomicrobium sp.]|nr:hypothetical protein [Rhizomicrobium sp.]